MPFLLQYLKKTGAVSQQKTNLLLRQVQWDFNQEAQILNDKSTLGNLYTYLSPVINVHCISGLAWWWSVVNVFRLLLVKLDCWISVQNGGRGFCCCFLGYLGAKLSSGPENQYDVLKEAKTLHRTAEFCNNYLWIHHYKWHLIHYA